MDYVPRRAAELIAKALADTRIVVVNGARQVGKSTLAELVLRQGPNGWHGSSMIRSPGRLPSKIPSGSSAIAARSSCNGGSVHVFAPGLSTIAA
jgi:hypothetical protein